MGRVRREVAGVVVLALIVGTIVFALLLSTRAFTDYTKATLRADRAGLVLESGADIKLSGVRVGKVGDIDIEGDEAVLELDIRSDKLDRIPANVLARIKPTTVFGTKFVDLQFPPDPSPEHLRGGAVLDARGTTVEINTVFENLVEVLSAVEPSKLNATLGALATALDGRGDPLGVAMEQADRYLAKLNIDLPQLQRDLAKGSRVLDTYADVTPELMRLLDNVTVTSSTIVDQQKSLDSFIAALTGIGRGITPVLAENERQLITALDLLRPTTGLLGEYSPELTCLLKGLDETNKVMEPLFTDHGINIAPIFLLGQDPYRYPEDLPVVGADNGPNCQGLPVLEGGELPARHMKTDSGADIFPRADNMMTPGDPPLVEYLFGPLPPLSRGVR